MSLLSEYRRAQDEFDAVLAAVPDDAWTVPSACTQWSVRDIAGHVIWGQEQLRCWATGERYAGPPGGPGTPHPGELAGPDPVATWRAARSASVATLDDAALRRTVTLPGLGEQPLAAIVTLLVTDHLAHAWDIAHAVGSWVALPADLVAGSLAWARRYVTRGPGRFAPELTPPAGADEQTRWLAYLGRAAWEPVPEDVLGRSRPSRAARPRRAGKTGIPVEESRSSATADDDNAVQAFAGRRAAGHGPSHHVQKEV